MSEEHTLYEIKVQTPVSPNELAEFCELVDSDGYTVVTDLECGEIELRDTAEGYEE